MPDAYPKLRGEIDAAPARHEGETYYILYDRAGITPSRLLVSPMGLLIAGRFDGVSSILDVADSLAREYGGGVECAEIERMAEALEEAHFLDGSRFQDFQAQAARDFRAAPVRAAASAGSAYDDDPALLTACLDRILADAPPPEEPAAGNASFPRGIIVPHIDYPRGAAGYGQCYGYLARLPAPRTVVVLGTAHVPLRERFALCDKAFATPLGTVEVDQDLAGRLRQAVLPHGDMDRDALAHRGEHSVELQAVWLRHIYGEGTRIVPLLAGSLGDFIEGGKRPEDAADDPVLAGVAACLAEAVAGGGVMLMASADLAHVGPRFGDERELTDRFLAEVEELDRHYLCAAASAAPAGLESLAAHGDRCHVCGSAPIFTMGMALPDTRGILLGYHQAVTPEMDQAVTFASMAFVAAAGNGGADDPGRKG